jgi:hypothetical protein
MDILLAWWPPSFGNSEWKFGTVTTTLASFPLLAMGLVLLAASGMGRGKKWLLRTMTIILVLIVLALVGCAAIYLPQVSPALAGVKDPTIKMGVQRAVLKTVAQLLMYPLVLGWIAWISWRHYRSISAVSPS